MTRTRTLDRAAVRWHANGLAAQAIRGMLSEGAVSNAEKGWTEEDCAAIERRMYEIAYRLDMSGTPPSSPDVSRAADAPPKPTVGPSTLKNHSPNATSRADVSEQSPSSPSPL